MPVDSRRRTSDSIMQRRITYGLAACAVFVAFLALSLAYNLMPALAKSTTSTSGSGASAPSPAPTPPAPAQTSAPAVGTVTLSLSFNGLVYTVPVPASQTVLAVMQTLASSDPSFTFTTKFDKTLGLFVYSIYGIPDPQLAGTLGGKPGFGRYIWVLRVNGVRPTTSFSSTTVSPGDTISWSWERRI